LKLCANGETKANLSRPAKRVVRFYNQRGTAEQWIKEGKNAIKWTRLSCHDFVDRRILETTEEVSSHPGETGHASQKSTETTPVPEKNRGRTKKKLCQSVEQAENRKKGPRGSWAGNHMGNVNQYE
jgi:hypothetical protein